MTPDISVIIPAYDVESYIQKAVRSALSQHGVLVEIVVIDDGSRDGTVRAVRALDDPRVILLEQPRNMGPGAARNRGIAAATGRWIALLDGDDVFLPGRLKRLVDAAERAGAEMIADNVLIFAEADDHEFPMFSDEDFERLGPRLKLPDLIRGKVSAFRSYTLAHLKPLFRADFLKAQGIVYPADLKVGEDYIFLAEALAKGGVCLLDPAAGYRYTTRHGSLSFRMTSASIDRMLVVEKMFAKMHAFDGEARAALERRKDRLREYRAYIAASEARAKGEWRTVFRNLADMPTAARYYLEPFWISVRYDIEPYWNAACRLFAPSLAQGGRAGL